MDVEIGVIGKPNTWTVSQPLIRIGTGANCDVTLSADEYPAVTDQAVELEVVNGMVSLATVNMPQGEVLLNNRPASGGSLMLSGDVLRIGTSGPELKISFVAREAAPEPLDRQATTVMPVNPVDRQATTVLPVSPMDRQATTVLPVNPVDRQATTVMPVSPVDRQATTVMPVSPVDRQATTVLPINPGASRAATEVMSVPSVLQGQPSHARATVWDQAPSAPSESSQTARINLPSAPAAHFAADAGQPAAPQVRWQDNEPNIPEATVTPYSENQEPLLKKLRLLQVSQVVTLLIAIGLLGWDFQMMHVLNQNQTAIHALQAQAQDAVSQFTPALDARLAVFQNRMDGLDSKMEADEAKMEQSLTVKMKGTEDQMVNNLDARAKVIEDRMVARMSTDLPAILEKSASAKH